MASRQATERVLREIQGAVRTNRQLFRALPPGCPPGQLGLLHVISQTGDVCASDLASRCHTDLSVVSRHLAHLDAQGLIERHPDPSDRRSHLIRVSPAGSALLARTGTAVASVAAAVLTDWTDAELDQLANLLARFTSSINAISAPSRVPA